MAESLRPLPLTWKGWFEGEKRPHQQIQVEITIYAHASSGGELLVDVYDDYLAFVGGSPSRVAALYRGYDFPRQRVLKPNNEPVATSGTLLAGDLVVGNKLVVAPGRPHVVILVAPDREDLDYERSKGIEYAHQPANIGFDDAGVPEWPGDDVVGAGEDEGKDEDAGEPQSVLQQATGRSAGASDPSAGAATTLRDAVGADPE